eukprot:s2213_g4.t1
MHADAYQHLVGAACLLDPLDALVRMVRCHKIHWNPSFISEPVALGNAMKLHAEVLSGSWLATQPTINVGKIYLPSALRSRTTSGRKQVRFCSFVEIASDDNHLSVVEPLSDEDELIAQNFDSTTTTSTAEVDVTSFMARAPQPRDFCTESSRSSSATSQSPTSPSTFPDDALWRSVQVYDLRANHARGRVQVQPRERTFSQVRRLLGHSHHDVAEIFTIQTCPKDLDAIHVTALLLVRHDDLLWGDNRRAVLVDLELHGPEYDSVVEIDRHTSLIPSPIHRSHLLRILGLDPYCKMMNRRCLLWIRGNLIPQQGTQTVELQHGDYIRVAVPPFEPAEVPTFVAVRACQQGLTHSEIVDLHRREPEFIDFLTQVDAEQPDDENALFQTSSLSLRTFDSTILNHFDGNECEASEYRVASLDAHQPQRQLNATSTTWPSWMRALLQAFGEQAAVASEEEGPIAFVTTWFLSGSFEYTSEESRPLQLDQSFHHWQRDATTLWQDKINFALPVHFALVNPEPVRHDFVWSIGHLLIFQDLWPPFVPSLLTLEFQSSTRTAINYVAAVIDSPTSPSRIKDLANLARLCVERQCTLHAHEHVFEGDDPVPVQPGEGMVFCIHPPVHQFHSEGESTPPQFHSTQIPVQDPNLAVLPIIEDQTDFTQELHFHWDVEAQPGPGLLERLLNVVTWCLHGDRIWYNDEARIVTLGEDFHMWEAQILRAWQDRLDIHQPTEFVFVWPPPESDRSQQQTHIIVHQHLNPQDRATLTTIYDDGVLNNHPFTTAVILPQVLRKTALIHAAHRAQDCPPLNLFTTCSTWQRGWEIDDVEPFRVQHGMTFMLIIQRQQFVSWDMEDDAHPEASSSTSLLQHKARLHQAHQLHPPDTGDRRQTTGQVAHTRWPDRPTVVQLAELIEPPAVVYVNFASVLHLHEEIQLFAHMFSQPWPYDLEVPAAAQPAFAALISPSQAQPLAYHFYTDGSKSAHTQVGMGVILIVETVNGLHYGGCLYKVLDDIEQSIYGEYGAIIWSLLWATHLSDQFWYQFQHLSVRFTFNFDAIAAGFAAAGFWQTNCAPSWKTLSRSLAQLLQTRHGIHNTSWHHIKAHVGHAWNECADQLAKYAAAHPSAAGSSSIWQQWLHQPEKLLASQWLWYHELMVVNDPRVPPLHNGFLVCIEPRLPEQHPHANTSRSTPTTPASVAHTIDLKLATANVMTLDAHGTTSITRQTILMQQFFDAKCTIVGVRIVASAPDLIVAKIKILTWTGVFVTARAPHSGRPLSEAMAFWNNLNSILQRKAAGLPVFFLGDSNAHLGELPSDSVGELYPCNENQAGQLFHNWLLHCQLLAPSTFSTMHTGDQHHTFVSPDGCHEVRIDYIAVPQAIQYDQIESRVATEIDLSVSRCDHHAVLCHLRFSLPPGRQSARPKHRRYDLNHLAAQLQCEETISQLHYQVPAPLWHVDPHTSANWLAHSTHFAVDQIAQPLAQWKRKSHVSETTWKLVDTKKALFKQLKALKRTFLHTVMKTCFLGWSSITKPSPAFCPTVADLPVWLRLHDHAVAQTQQQLRAAAQQALNAIRQDDSNFYQALADKSAHTYSVEGLAGIWKQIRAVLPKHRDKSHQVRRDIDDELLRHFEGLEAGTTRPAHEVALQCFQRNKEEQAARPQLRHLALEELPTLLEVENLCLKQKPRKAAGCDGIPSEICKYGAVAIAPQLHSVLCKSLVHAIEPFSYKGGKLCAIYKGKGDVDDPAGYRGILLSNCFAKIAHGWARHRLLPTMQRRKTIGQLGGLPSQQTVTGVQIVRLHRQIGARKHISTATLFIDLRSAFHHMIREFVFSTKNIMVRSVLERFLDTNEFDVLQIAQELDTICSLDIDDISPGLRMYLHDLHHHTWFHLVTAEAQSDNQLTWTLRGTRPGSPLADLGFNLLMTQVLQSIQSALLDMDDYVAGSQALGLFIPPIAWMDDIAVGLAAPTAPQLRSLVEQSITAIHSVFRAKGFTMNLDRGKTEVIVMYRGPGAVACRTALFATGHVPQITVASDTHILTVKSRLGAARQAFEQMKRPIFCNSVLPVAGRLQLFSSLILSRLLYGCAVWAEVSATSFRKLEAAVTGYYRRILNNGFWSPNRQTDKDFLQSNELIPFRIFWAKQRLCYLQHVARHGKTFHKALLLDELSASKGWLYEVTEDLRWFSTLHQLPFDLPHDRSTWTEAWQVLRQCTPWTSWVRRAVRKYLKQERIAFEVRFYHDHIQRELEGFGMQLLPTDFQMDTQPLFACHFCPAKFHTAQQLALHAFKLHDQRAEEAYYVQSEVCPGCLKTFHTTYRVIQHLRYRGNRCWERIAGVRPKAVLKENCSSRECNRHAEPKSTKKQAAARRNLLKLSQ